MTVTTQVSPPAIAPPEKLTLPAPAVGAKVGDPQPLVDALVGLATTIAPGAAGKVSVKATPEMALFGFGLLIVKVSVLVPPVRIGLGAKALSICGANSTNSVSLAEPVGPALVPDCVVDRKPLMLVLGPGTELVTLTDTVHEPLAGIVPPVRLRLVALSAGAPANPQVLLTKPAAFTDMPVGRSSTNAAPDSGAAFGLVNVKVRIEVPPAAIVEGENSLSSAGCRTVLQPVKTTSSRMTSEPGLELFELK